MNGALVQNGGDVRHMLIMQAVQNQRTEPYGTSKLRSCLSDSVYSL